MSRPLSFVVLGDSAAYGTGDITKANRPMGWAYRIASAITGPMTYLNLARPGAKSTELVEHQLPIATLLRPDVAIVVVGGNDMLRNNFCPIRLKENLTEIFTRFSALGTHVITLELHDPSKVLKLPKALERALLKRVDAVNAVYQELSRVFPIIPIRARDISGVHDRKNWHVDLLHPGPRGHFLLAEAAVEKLARRGLPIEPLEAPEFPAISTREKVSWMLRKGTPWFIKRSFDLLPVALFLITKELVLSALSRFRLEPTASSRDEAFEVADQEVSQSRELIRTAA
jgi:lysophospholipase L1-like esterase